MDRIAACLPESIDELCLIRLGLMVRKLSGFPFAIRIGRAINQSAKQAVASGAGLLRSEVSMSGPGHFSVVQYWSSFEALETWSHQPPHSDWWREAQARMRKQADFGIYHETYLVPRSKIESIYLNCPPVGLSAFGPTSDVVGSMTTSRDRLGRRTEGS